MNIKDKIAKARALREKAVTYYGDSFIEYSVYAANNILDLCDALENAAKLLKSLRQYLDKTEIREIDAFLSELGASEPQGGE